MESPAQHTVLLSSSLSEVCKLIIISYDTCACDRLQLSYNIVAFESYKVVLGIQTAHEDVAMPQCHSQPRVSRADRVQVRLKPRWRSKQMMR